MTKRPHVPTFPASWGRARKHDYDVLVAAYKLAPDEDITLAAINVVDFLADTPKCPTYVVQGLLSSVREWNAAHPPKHPAPIPCPNCGEARRDHIEAEGTVVHHADITGLEGKIVTITPKLCFHPSFAIHCGVCDYRWGTEEGYQPSLKLGGDEATQVQFHVMQIPPPSNNPGDLN